MKLTVSALLLFSLLLACNTHNNTNGTTTTVDVTPMDTSVTDAGSSLGNSQISTEPSMQTYDTIATLFEGHPDVENVKKLMDTVLLQCNMEITHDNVMHLGNALSSLRKDSKAGVTEMDILKHMYQHGTSTDLATRLKASATVLEQTK